MEITPTSIQHIDHGRERYNVTFAVTHVVGETTHEHSFRALAYADDMDNATDDNEVVEEALSKVISKMEQWADECDRPDAADVVERQAKRQRVTKGAVETGTRHLGKKAAAGRVNAAKAKQEARRLAAEAESSGANRTKRN